MATVPTHDKIERKVFNEIAKYAKRAGEVAPLGAVSVNIQRSGVTAAELDDCLGRMVEEGLITLEGVFIKLTDAGFTKM